MTTTTKEANSLVRMQIPLPGPVAILLAKHADEMDRSHAWLACWAMRIAADYRQEIGTKLCQRICDPGKVRNRVYGNDEQEVRLQVRVPVEVAAWIEETAMVVHSTPGKFAALVIDLMLMNNPLVLAFMKTPAGLLVRRWFNGEEDFSRYDDSESGNIKPDAREGIPDARRCA